MVAVVLTRTRSGSVFAKVATTIKYLETKEKDQGGEEESTDEKVLDDTAEHCFTVEDGYIVMDDMLLTYEQLPRSIRKIFDDCKKKGKNKIENDEDYYHT